MIMEENKREVSVTVKPELGYAGPTLCFNFTNLSFLFWAGMLGFLGDGATLPLGCIQFGIFTSYVIGSVVLLKRGADFEGNVFFIFASFFGGAAGLLNIIGPIAHYAGIPFSDRAPGICWLLCGILLFGILPSAKYNPLLGFLFYIFGGAGLFCNGLMTLEILKGALINGFIAWCFFAAGVCGLCICISTMNGFEGIQNFPPIGKALFFKSKKKES